MLFFIEALVGCIITLVGFWFMSDVVFEKKSKIDLIRCSAIIACATIVTLINVLSNNVDVIIRTIVVFFMMILFNKYNYKRKLADTLLGTFIVYINFYLADIILAILLSVGSNLSNINLFTILQYSLIGNILTIIILGILMICFKDIYVKIFKNIANYDLNIISGIIVVLLIIALLLSKMPIEKCGLNIEFVTIMLLIIMFCLIGIYIIKQKSEIDKITDKYIKLAKYAKNNEGLLEEYRINLHENKNRLITIDSMVPAKYKEVHEYIGELIKKNKSNKYYWLTELKYVPSSELKGFINYKIMEMMNDKLDVEVNISRELDKKIIKNYNVKDKEELYSIVGIFLDNAYEASKLSKEKAVSIQMFMDKKDLKLIIANTYKGKIDLEKIDEYGYSSKGINRGTGLHIVSEIVSRNQLFEKETSILDNYFVQTLILHSKKIKKKKS